MNSTIFIPKVIRVGYDKREDTYTKSLAYVIYYDSKNKLRKETSWESWRDKDIEPNNFDNVPTEGFVLNKKVGGTNSGWNARQTYCRIYDPRGFEFEITIQNLLYILENTNSIRGKGLDGTFVYAWDGKDILLIPTGAPEFIEFSKYSDMLNKPQSIKGKDLILGARYKTNLNKIWTYLGRFNYYNGDSKDLGLHYWFYNESTDNKYDKINRVTSLSGKVIQLVNSESSDNYADLISKVECYDSFSPVDYENSTYEGCSIDYLKSNYQNYDWNLPICLRYDGVMQKVCIEANYGDCYYRYSDRTKYKLINRQDNSMIAQDSFENLIINYNFQMMKLAILKNGKIKKKES